MRATAADSIFSTPAGLLFVNGLQSEPMFFKGTLDKLGIEADFVAHGEYKSAPDTYTRTSMSPQQREVINEILDDIFNRYVDALATARNISLPDMRQRIDEGLYSSEAAVQAGLIDRVVYYNTFKEHLKERHGKSLKLVSAQRYADVPFTPGGSVNKRIAVIYGVGTIIIGGDGTYAEGNMITSAGMANSIRKAVDDEDIAAIILRIDSPGGSGTASDIIWQEVVRAREKQKPVIVSVSDVAASGGYYIAMAADSIVAHPGSIVGSIGVFAGKFAMKKFYDKIGVSTEAIARGKNAGLFSSSEKFTAGQRRLIEQYIMSFYQTFITKAAEGRGMTVEEIDRIARGRVYTGVRGKELGLVDRLGDFSDAVMMAKGMIGVPRDELVALIEYPRLKSFWDRLFDLNVQATAPDVIDAFARIPAPMRRLLEAVPHLRDGEPLYLWPDHIDIK